jgi:hypothetical protein
LTTLKVLEARPAACVFVSSADALIVHVPAAIAVIFFDEESYVQAPDGFPETVTVTVPAEGVVVETSTGPSITKSGIVPGEITGSLASFEEAAARVAEPDAVERALSPTRLVAITLTVYVPGVTFANSVLVVVGVVLVTSLPAAFIR